MSCLSKALEKLSEYNEFSGALSVDGRLSPVRMKYESQAVMEIRGLPNGLPPYLRFEKEVIRLFPGGNYAEPEELKALNIYRLFDPRTMRECLLDSEGKQVPRTTRWEATFTPKKLKFTITETLVEWMKGQEREGTSLWDSQELFFVVEAEEIKEMSILDLPPLGPRLSIGFSTGQSPGI